MKKLLFSLFLVALSVGLFAQERILFFDAQAHVNNDGSVSIVENITVNAEHQQIRRGLYRDIPLRIGEKIQIEGLRMDHEPHPFFTEKISGGIRVNFGDDRYIERGQHTYSFAYKFSNVIGSFPQYDELYWNVTGNDWVFPIEYARAEVFLPEGAEPFEDKISVYTGKSGSKASHAQREGLKFWITQPLSAHSGMTVAVPFEKGHIHLSMGLKLFIWVRDHYLATGWILFGLMCIYCYVLWYLKGRDPVSRGAVRRFDPPQGISAVMAKYIYDMTFDNKIVSVWLTSLAIKGAVKIRQEGNKHFIVTKNDSFSSELSKEELHAYHTLQFMTEIKDEPNPEILTIQSELFAKMEVLGKKYFAKNSDWALPLLLLVVLYVAGLYWLNNEGIFIAIISFLVVSYIRQILTGPFHRGKVFFSIFFFSLAVLLAMALKYSEFGKVTGIEDWILLFVAFASLIAFFLYVVKKYTKAGRKIKDELDGFKQYLSVAESARVLESDPTNAQKIFCDYLPYAYALGVESKWVKSFEEVFTHEQVKEMLFRRGIYCYMGVDTLLNHMSSSVAQASTTPHSGSGGGGSSGGGFGGGGGGGR